MKLYRAFSLPWPVCKVIFIGTKETFLHKKKVSCPRDISLFWDTNMADVTSYDNTIY